jgi:hypothetical protein
MGFRFRHCVECPECSTRYLVGFSPYGNGSYLVSLRAESAEEYKLVCSCCRPPVYSRWSRSELKMYAVSNQAYASGYGSAQEIWVLKAYRESTGVSMHSEPRRRQRLA